MNTVTTEIYPMPAFARIGVSDMATSSAWYKTIGFADIYTIPGGMMTHLRFAKYADIMLVKRMVEDQVPPSKNMVMYFTSERGGTDQIAETLRRIGHADSIVEGPVLRPWNARELLLRDPDGFFIAFAEQGEPNRSFDEVMKETADQMKR